jgi:hypothetical protein
MDPEIWNKGWGAPEKGYFGSQILSFINSRWYNSGKEGKEITTL